MKGGEKERAEREFGEGSREREKNDKEEGDDVFIYIYFRENYT